MSVIEIKNLSKKYGDNIAVENMASQATDKPNFESILKEFNVNLSKGIVAENDTQHYSARSGPWYAFADGIIGYASGLSSYVLTPYTKGLTHQDNKDSNITYTALASTSDLAVSKTNPSESKSYEKQDGDLGDHSMQLYL